MHSVVFRRPRDLLKILLPFSRPARRRRCSSGGNALSSQQISLQQPLYFFRAYWTLNKQQVAAIIFTVGMAVARRAALVAMRDNLIRYTFAHPLVKNKNFLPIKRTGKPCSRALRAYSIIPPSICQTLLNPLCFIRALAFSQRMPPVQYMTIFFIFMCLHHLDCFWQLLTEGICRNFERVFKVPHFILIVVTHVDK